MNCFCQKVLFLSDRIEILPVVVVAIPLRTGVSSYTALIPWSSGSLNASTNPMPLQGLSEMFLGLL